MGSASLKVAGGKLVKASVESAGGRISSLKITGDFFLHPEEAISEIESSLKNKKLDEMELASAVALTIIILDAHLLGATPRDFAKVIVEASK